MRPNIKRLRVDVSSSSQTLGAIPLAPAAPCDIDPSCSRTGCYLYCFALPRQPLDLSGSTVDPRYGLRVVWYGEIGAIWSPVGFDQFSIAKFQPEQADPQTIAAVAMRHDEVIAGVMRTAPVLPVKLCTIFHREQQLAAFLADHVQAIYDFLVRVQQKQEWGVKVFLDWQAFLRVRSPTEPCGSEGSLSGHLSGSRLASPLTTAGPGLRYFEQKRGERQCREQVHADTARGVAEVGRILRRFTQDIRPLRVRSKSHTGPGRELVWNVACLLDRDQFNGLRHQLGMLAEALQNQGLSLAITGPWAPYNFCPSLDERTESGVTV